MSYVHLQELSCEISHFSLSWCHYTLTYVFLARISHSVLTHLLPSYNLKAKSIILAHLWSLFPHISLIHSNRPNITLSLYRQHI